MLFSELNANSQRNVQFMPCGCAILVQVFCLEYGTTLHFVEERNTLRIRVGFLREDLLSCIRLLLSNDGFWLLV